VNQTVRGLVIFVSVLLTIAFWMPLSNSPRLGPNGGTITDTFFGVFRYATMSAVMKEPDFSLSWSVNALRLVITVGVTVVFWLTVMWVLKRGNPAKAQ
jgi:hypothetical protein